MANLSQRIILAIPVGGVSTDTKHTPSLARSETMKMRSAIRLGCRGYERKMKTTNVTMIVTNGLSFDLKIDETIACSAKMAAENTLLEYPLA